MIFSSEESGKDMELFIDKVYDIPNILLLIKVDGESVIGGYTRTGWKKGQFNEAKHGDWLETTTADKDAFLFYLKSWHG